MGLFVGLLHWFCIFLYSSSALGFSGNVFFFMFAGIYLNRKITKLHDGEVFSASKRGRGEDPGEKGAPLPFPRGYAGHRASDGVGGPAGQRGRLGSLWSGGGCRPEGADMSIKALEGVRVIEFGPYVALPLTGRILAALGAEVIKV